MEERKADEFIALIGRPSIANIIKSLLIKIEESGCNISIDSQPFPNPQDQFSSHIVTINEFAKNCRIRIWHKSSNPFYDIFHEWGHHLSGDVPQGDNKIIRELIAWDYGIREFLKFPELLDEWPIFINYKNECLKSYLNSFEQSTY